MGSLEAIQEFMTAVKNAIPISNKCITTINAQPHTLRATLLAASNAIMVASILIRALIIARQKLQPQQQDIQTQQPSFGVVIKTDLTIYGVGGTYVTQVQPNSPADGQLDIGDIIRKINDEPVSSKNVSLSTTPKKIGTKLTLQVSKLNNQDFTYDKNLTDVELVSANVPTYNVVDAALHEAISAAIFESQNAIISLGLVGTTNNTFKDNSEYSENVYIILSSVLNDMNKSLSLLSVLSQQQPPLSTRTIVGLMKKALDIVDNIMMGVKRMYSDWSREGLNILGNDAAKYYCNNVISSSRRTIDNLKEFSNKYLNTYLSVYTATANAASANARLVESAAAAASVNAAAAANAATAKPSSSFLDRLIGKKGGKKTRNNNKNKKTRNNKKKKTRNNKNKKTRINYNQYTILVKRAS